MMPFSVIRIWTTGILSWLVLAGGIYCLWEWSERRESQRNGRAVVIEVPSRQPNAAADVPVVRQKADDAWPYLAAGIALLSFSGIGFFPVVLLLGNPGFGAAKGERGADIKADVEIKIIERPDGSRLHIEIYGPKDGPTLVFTHGWSLDSTAWYYARHELAADYRVVLWDLPGLGQSRGSQTGNYEIEKMAGDLAAVVKEAGRGPIVLIGHSIGGMITQTFCRLFSEELGTRVAGIVLVHTTYTNPLNTALGANFWKAIEKPVLVPLNYLTIWLAPLAWLSNWQSYLNGSLHLMTRIASFSGKQTWGQLNYSAYLAAKAWPAVLARGNLAMTRFDEERTLPDIDLPALVIAGHYDRMTKPSASARIEQLVKQPIPFAVHAGHLGLWEAHGDIADAIRQFVAKFAIGEESASQRLPADAINRQ